MSEQIDQKKKKKSHAEPISENEVPLCCCPGLSRLLQTLKVLTTSKLAFVITCDVVLDKSHRDPPVITTVIAA
jgi:hypothetical protein